MQRCTQSKDRPKDDRLIDKLAIGACSKGNPRTLDSMANAMSQSDGPGAPVRTRGSISDNQDVHTAPQLDLDYLLKYLPEYCIVICKSCRFAVQPSALSSHLLRHRMYRVKRRKLLDRVAELRLLEPEDVALPLSKVPPFSDLPMTTGYRCTMPNCDHLCRSQKRMSQHLREHHQVGPRTDADDHMQQVHLQTFFRGNKVRYFEVEPDDIPLETTRSSNQPLEYQFLNLPQSRAQESSSLRPSSRNGHESTVDATITQRQMENLLYLHQYTTCTSLSLARGTESTDFWTRHIVLEAPSQSFLMHGILGVAAFHQALLTTDAKECNRHHAAGLRHQSAGLATFRSVIARPTEETSTALTAFARLLGVQFCVEALLEAATDVDGSARAGVSKILDLQQMLKGGCDLLLNMQDLLPLDSELVLSAEASQGLDQLEMSTELLPGSTPYLINEVCAQLGNSTGSSVSTKLLFRASNLSDVRHLVDLCHHARKLADPQRITVSWVEEVLPSRSKLLEKTHSLAEAIANSLGLADLKYHNGQAEGRPGPCPILLCYPHIPPATYAQLASLPARLIARVPGSTSADLEAFDQAMASLVSCYSRSYVADATWARWNGIESWPKLLPDHFLRMVEATNPLSLVLVAHWCALFSRQENSYWFLRGQSKRMLNIILANLSVELQDFVRNCVSSLDMS